MWDIRLNLNKKNSGFWCGFLVLIFCTTLLAESPEALIPLKNKGIMLVEKEMIRLPHKKNKTSYRALLFLEDYLLNNGLSQVTMKILHELIKMRDITKDLKKKAFLDCEAWRVLDHDLKNYENRELLEQLKQKRNFSTADHIRFRKIVSEKVSDCIKHIGKNWMWQGAPYTDMQYDIQAENAIKSVESYLILKKIESKK